MNSPDFPAALSSDARARQSRYSQGAEIIKQRIKQGVYKPGEQLPSLRALSAELNLSFPAVQRAVRQLETEAILESRHGVGIRVLEAADCGGTALLFGFVQPYFSRFSMVLQHYMEQALDSRSNLCVVKSTHNDSAREQREIERLIESGVNGLLIWPVDGDTNSQFLQQVSERLPVVFVDRTLEDIKAPSVVLDYENGARQIVRHLHKIKRSRILVVCDPADISSFNQLKRGLREEAEKLGLASTLTIIDYSIVQLIEAAYAGDYSHADACAEMLAPLVQSGDYDALFCPQSEWFDQVFADSGRAELLKNVHCVTLRTSNGPPHSRRHYDLKIEEWELDTANMLVQALNLLQDMALRRRANTRSIRLPISRKNKRSSDSAL